MKPEKADSVGSGIRHLPVRGGEGEAFVWFAVYSASLRLGVFALNESMFIRVHPWLCSAEPPFQPAQKKSSN
jgi:hypothetical protein